MNGYNFTERARKVLARAREESVALRHQYVGCEHMLLGLLSDDGLASVVIQNLGVELQQAEAALKQMVKVGATHPASIRLDLPYTSRAKKTLELAMSEARELNHSYVGTEHLLLGLLREDGNIGAQMLHSFGITLERARVETLRILGVEVNAISPPTGEKPHLIYVSLRYSNGAVVAKSFSDTAEAARFLSAP